MKVVAVIVTYNRLKSLQKCIRAVQEGTRKPDGLLVVNNGSTDGTEAWLAGQGLPCHTQANAGGAGGFSSGIEKAYRMGADWIWLMDDDTIACPDALERLLLALEQLGPGSAQTGFLSSAALWTDGSLHEMNRTYALTDPKRLAALPLPAVKGLPVIQFGTFVSMLLNAKAVEKVGLPIREYFIWNDDVEYSKRIIRSGLAGLAVPESMVVHETPTNHQSNVFIDPPSSLWKFRYGFRNELFTKRLHEGAPQFWLSWTHRFFIMPFRIILRRKNHRWPFIKMVWATSLKAITFRPQIERVTATELGAQT